MACTGEGLQKARLAGVAICQQPLLWVPVWTINPELFILEERTLENILQLYCNTASTTQLPRPKMDSVSLGFLSHL